MKYNLLSYCLLLFAVSFSLSSCQNKGSVRYIGISQCAGGEWRDLQNEEMRVEATFYHKVKLEFCDAADNDSAQISDIRYFIKKKVDLLIVSPNTMDALCPVIEEAYKAGIPVVLFDRRISSDKYTAFVGANNYHIGEQAGDYLGGILNKKGEVIEIENNMNSAPFRERHEGFMNAMKAYPDIHVKSIPTGKTDEDTRIYIDSILSHHIPLDAVFTHIDNSCRPVYEALKAHHAEQKVITLGIDGMPFKGLGIDRVLEKKQSATFAYPTGGDKIMQVAMKILLHKPFLKENELSSYVIDQRNVRSVRAQQDQFIEQNQKIRRLYDQSDKYVAQVAEGKIYLMVVVIIAFLLGVILFVVYRAYWMRDRFNKQLVKQNDKIVQQKNEMQQQRDRLVEMTKRLEEATNAKLVFFTNVSHDFRTPLTLISSPLAQLKEHSSWGKPELRLYEIIQKNIDVLMRLVNQIIDFRKFENGKLPLNLSRCDLSLMVQDWSRAFYGLAQEKGINFKLDIDRNFDYSVDLDVEKFERVYYNLVYNAFKFTANSGSITIGLTCMEESTEKRIRFTISDTGIGMSPANMERIFERFYKVDSPSSGSGIGLNLVKAYVELHGGNIKVESKEHQGTCFIIDLPSRIDNATMESDTNNATKTNLIDDAILFKDLQESPEEEEISKEPDEKDQDQQLVLVIDDNADIREFIHYLLKDSYKVIQAADGNQGLKLAEKFIPDIIISDVMMPVMDGLEFCKRLKENISICHIPVILLTACSLDEQRVSGYESGADSYISKPFSAELLLSRVANLIQNRKRIKPSFVHAPISSQVNIKNLDEKFMRNFRNLVEEHISDSNLSMDWLGENLGMSRVQLYRKVKALSGYIPSDIIREARMKKAEALLKIPGSTITDVAYNTGFSSPSYFTKCYKEYFGKLPDKG